ncbi:CheR family methyltransferase [Helicovermis profundi]|uniref:protein-glutamate O-methyltransferase n=1 Tax=Helicovermis profundi TaxID=3065157 RepID=A0AAU9EED7_9FIRM|nr:protein-glutamate O-methyltransferase CheR [Clostridia bacterium S502]
MEGYEKFKQQILKKTGLDLSLYKERQMKRRIESLIKRHKVHSFEEYFKEINTNKEVFDEFINYLTINVSEFYRNPNQWSILVNEVFPELLKGKSSIKIWSAACSTGEEPYTIVMALSTILPLNKIKIIAADIDKEAINKAKVGIYNEKSIAGVPKDIVKKYFTKVGNSYKVSEDIKKCVEFRNMNLLKDKYPDKCDLITCRNVMIYFTEDAKDLMYKKFNDALIPNGVLFVGSTEQIILPQRFNFKAKKTFFYQKVLK